MRLRIFLFGLLVSLLAFFIGSPTAQAQTGAFHEQDPFWQMDARVNMPVVLCHIPPGNPGNAHTIEVGQAAVPAHLAHGDTMGACPDPGGECPPYLSPAPATGQTECWDEPGFPIDCAGTGQDGEYQAGISVDPRFTDNGDGTVTDNLTGLIWLQDANCFGLRIWTNALSDAKTLAASSDSCIPDLTDGSVAGDWRLPNINELHSLIDFGQTSPALTPGHPFSWALSGSYWSSTSLELNPGRAWNVYLDYGSVDADYKTNPLYFVWPVRGPE